MPNQKPPIPASILDLIYRRATSSLDKSLVDDSSIEADIEFICRCSNLAGTRFLMACLVAKLSKPSLDIRKPYMEIGGQGVYSGRYYDETYVAPFVFMHELPVNPTTSFLTPAFRTNKTIIEPGVQLIGRPKKLYEKVVNLITAVYTKRVAPENLLAEIVRWLLIVRNERKQRLETLLAALKPSEGEIALPAESIVTLIHQHLTLPKSARLPVLIVAAAYQAAQEYLGERHLPLEGHNAADKQTGALGDVQIVLKTEDDIITVYEMKAKQVTREDIEIALHKLATSASTIDNYIFITTDRIDEEVKAYAATIHTRIGIEFVILDCLGFLRHFLHLFYRIRMRFLEAYQNLVMAEPDSAVNPLLKEAILSLRLATETAIAQPIEDEVTEN
ncbi:MAG: DNA methyltransferase [Acidobacteriota bacterium]